MVCFKNLSIQFREQAGCRQRPNKHLSENEPYLVLCPVFYDFVVLLLLVVHLRIEIIKIFLVIGLIITFPVSSLISLFLRSFDDAGDGRVMIVFEYTFLENLDLEILSVHFRNVHEVERVLDYLDLRVQHIEFGYYLTLILLERHIFINIHFFLLYLIALILLKDFKQIFPRFLQEGESFRALIVVKHAPQRIFMIIL
jgi:hypothetical protein